MHIYISPDQICRQILRFQRTWTYNLDPEGLHISWNVAGSTFVTILVLYFVSHSWEGTWKVQLLFRGIQNYFSCPEPSGACLWKIFLFQYSRVEWPYPNPVIQNFSWGNHCESEKCLDLVLSLLSLTKLIIWSSHRNKSSAQEMSMKRSILLQ